MPENNWSREEVEAVVSDYFDMLEKERSSIPFNKAEHNRLLRKLLIKRTRSAIEKKHQNISAVLLELGFPYVEGYKPLPNYQGLLQKVVGERLSVAISLNETVNKEVVARIEQPPQVKDILSIRVPVPKMDKNKIKPVKRVFSTDGPVQRRNYLEIEARNSSLGSAGEELVLEFEQKRLWSAGRKQLSRRIEHVSKKRGDYFGYDVLSFELSGKERYIEVKTTRYGPLTPFFASRNEVEVSEDLKAQYQLYRLFDFFKNPRLFMLSGSLWKSSQLTPMQYSAIPR
jgi:Domain of unknown function (DUF3883)